MAKDFGYTTEVTLHLIHGFSVKMLHFYKIAKCLFILISEKDFLLVNNQNRQFPQNQMI